jgi:hypothetical protein
MSWNSIGPFRFVSLSRPPELLQQQVVTRARPGVDGVMLQRTGRRGRAFQIVSVVDAGTLEQAMTIYWEYTTIVGGSRVAVTWADQALINAGVLFYVTQISEPRMRRIVRGHGGLNGISYARLECTWTLQPVDIG